MECMDSIKATMSDTSQKIQSMDSQLAPALSQLAKMQLHLEDIEDPSLKKKPQEYGDCKRRPWLLTPLLQYWAFSAIH